MRFVEEDKVKYQDGKMMRYGTVKGVDHDIIEGIKRYRVEFTYYTYADNRDLKIQSRATIYVKEGLLMKDDAHKEEKQAKLDRLGVLHQFQLMAVHTKDEKWFEEVGKERRELELSLA